ncbi:MAG: SAM-dependent methyltransferase, partial [Mesorhizobium sp.]
IWLTEDKAPDRTATAVFGDVWFSSRAMRADSER